MEPKRENRKQYKRPQIAQVKLEVEEAVLAFCKTLGGNDPTKGGNSKCEHTQGCKTTPGS
jgi:hypothetical protein